MRHQTDLLVVVLLYYGSALVVLGGAGDTQGNSTNDMRAWGERIAAARDDVVDRVRACFLLHLCSLVCVALASSGSATRRALPS